MEKIWLKSYPKGVPAEINPDAYQSIVHLFEESCTQFSKDPAFYSLGVTITFQQLEEYSRYFCAYLQTVLKIKKGTRVALMLPNILQYPIALFGCLRAGCIVVNVNPLYTAPELIHQMNDSGAEVIIVLDQFARTVKKSIKKTKIKKIIVTRIGDIYRQPKALFTYLYLKYVKKSIPKITFRYIPFRKVLSRGRRCSFSKIDIQSEEIAFLQYTGGTTGVSKGAMLSHRNIIANILQAESWFRPVFEKDSEIIITALPLYHIFSLTANCLFMLKIGGFNILIANPRLISTMIADMAKFKFTIITGVNTLFNALLKNQRFAELDFSKMKISLGGGMAVQRAVAEKWQQVTGKPILEAYGLTETSPCVCINPPDLKAYNGTVGLPVSSTEVGILDNDYKEVAIGTPGELAVKGPQVMVGYWNNPEETKKVFTKEGWLLTGDIAAIDHEGYVSLLERKKDMILVSGFNVYPNEIEDVLMHIPGVREAAVIGVPSSKTGEAVKAFIVRENDQLTEKEIHDFCRKKLTGYKMPRYIEFCEDLPKSNIGKILRRALK